MAQSVGLKTPYHYTIGVHQPSYFEQKEKQKITSRIHLNYMKIIETRLISNRRGVREAKLNPRWMVLILGFGIRYQNYVQDSVKLGLKL